MGLWDWTQDNILHPVRDFVFDPANIGTALGFALGGPAGAAAGRAVGNAADRVGEEYLDTGTGLREADPITLGSTAKNAATGFVLGQGAELASPHVGKLGNALGFGDEAAAAAGVGDAVAASSLPAPAAPSVAGTPLVSSTAGVAATPGMVGAPVAAAPAAQTAPAVADAGGFSGWWDDLSGFEQAYVASQGVGTAADLYGAYQEGQEMDRLREEEDERREARARLFLEFLRNPDRFSF